MVSESRTTSRPADDADLVRAWVFSSRAAQGLPPTVTDPGVVARVAVLLGAAGASRPQQAERADVRADGPSGTPDDLDAGGV